jgi:glycine dehydrogenase
MKTDAFALRHIGPRESDLKYMFKTIGVENLDQLISETVPNNIRLKNV